MSSMSHGGTLSRQGFTPISMHTRKSAKVHVSFTELLFLTERKKRAFFLLQLILVFYLKSIPSSRVTHTRSIHENTLGLLVDKDNVIDHQLVINYRLLIRILTNPSTVDKRKTKRVLITEGLWTIVDKIWN